MQTPDIQQEIQPIRYAAAAQSEKTDKHAAIGKDENNNDFHTMMQKILAETEADAEDSQSLAMDEKQLASSGKKEKNTDFVSSLNKMHKKTETHKKNSRQAEQAPVHGDDASFAAIDMMAFAESSAAAPAETAIQSEQLYDKPVFCTQIDGDLELEENVCLYAETEEHISDTNRLAKKDKKQQAFSAAAQDDDKKSSFSNKKEFMQPEIEEYQYTAKHKNIKRAQPVITVIDERSMGYAASAAADAAVHEAGAAVVVEHTNITDMVLDFHVSGENNSLTAENGPVTQESSPSRFSSILAERVQALSNDFVQASTIILKDNNAGIIRLQLQPAYLGSVRINLELGSDKKILGKIVVNSKESYDAFKESIGALAEAFEEGGFSGAHFDVSWSGESGSSMAQEDSDFNNSFSRNSHLEVMQEKHYADTGITYAFENNQTINVLA